jgi:SAM-dependent methyltransferase
MFLTYKEIFNVREHQYHHAMSLCPHAREQEFLNSIAILETQRLLKKGDKIIDIPSGGCYLKKYLPSEINYIAFEESEGFIKQTKYDKNIQVEYFQDNLLTQIKSNSIDILFSIAGLHHNPNLKKLFAEISRVLHSESFAIIADICKGSDQDYFLNEFVDQNSSAGHKGVFLDEITISDLNSASLEVVVDKVSKYHWHFVDEEKMVLFCKNLFGIDKVNDDKILKAIKSYLGVECDGDRVLMNWSLRNILVKPKIL